MPAEQVWRTSAPHWQVESWEAFASLAGWIRRTLGPVVWRGHASATWALESTFERQLRKTTRLSDFARSASDPPYVLEGFAQKHLERFKRACRGRRKLNSSLSFQSPDDEWWAFGRHEGLVAPLLDWTRSPYVAAFFAFEDIAPIHKEGGAAGAEGQSIPRTIFALREGVVAEWDYSGSINSTDALWWLRKVDPFIDDSGRLICQDGICTRSRLGFSFEECLAENLVRMGMISEQHSEELTSAWLGSTLLRIDIADAVRARALIELRAMNIHYLSLFPDVHGSAMHTNQSLEQMSVESIERANAFDENDRSAGSS